MTKNKTTLAVLLAAGALAVPIVLQQQALSAARAEHSVLEARLRDLPEPATPAPPSPAQANETAQRNRDDLARLRLEVANLRTRISELTLEVQRADIARVSNVAASTIENGAPIGQTVKLREVRDVGHATPAALIQTFVFSVTQGDTNRLFQLLEFDPATDPALVQKTFQELGQVAAAMSSAGTNAGFAQEIRLLEDQPAENNDHWVLTETTENSGSLHRERGKLRQTATGWKILIGTNGAPVSEPIPNQP